MKEKIKGIMAQIFEMEASAISDNADIKTIESWDSLNHFKLIMALEDEFGVKFRTDVITELTSIHKIIDELE